MKNKIKELLSAFLLIAVFLGASFSPSRPAWSADNVSTYGVSWGTDGLGALEIGALVGRKLSIRFRAEQTGSIDKVIIYLKDQSFPYYAGDGGQVLVEIQPDDGTAAHLPSGTVLSSHLITNPLSEPWNTTVTLDSTVNLVEGTWYHIVLTNPVADPVNNYISLNNLHSPVAASAQPGQQPIAILRKRDTSASWVEMSAYLPIFGVHFTNNYLQGQGYIDALSVSGQKSISGNNMVRSALMVGGEDKLVSKVFVWAKKTSGTAGLNVRLETSTGNLVEEGIIPAVNIGNTEGWVEFVFSSPRLLSSGAGYHLVLSAPATDVYSTYPIQDGIANGLPAGNIFQDEQWEFSDGNAWQRVTGSSAFHMQACFGLVTANPTISKTVDKTSARSGDVVTYTISYANPTQKTYTDAQIEDLIPFDTTFVQGSITTSGAIFDGSRIIYHIGSWAPGVGGTFSFQVQVK